jgi:sec-independent protein translocase protein TatB
MLLLSPAKLLVVLVVALLVLGPDRLPKVAKQIGGLIGDLRRLREKLESEVRGTFPDLPSTDTIHQAVRSPLSFLDGLSDDREGSGPTAPDVASSGGRVENGAVIADESQSDGTSPVGAEVGHVDDGGDQAVTVPEHPS